MARDAHFKEESTVERPLQNVLIITKGFDSDRRGVLFHSTDKQIYREMYIEIFTGKPGTICGAKFGQIIQDYTSGRVREGK